MSKLITIAVDAMGGDGSPKKVIDGIAHHFSKNNNTYYKIFGDSVKIIESKPISKLKSWIVMNDNMGNN